MTTIRMLRADDAPAYVALRREMLADAPHAFLAGVETDVGCTLDGARERLGVGPASPTFGAFDEAGELIGAVGLFGERHRKAAHKMHVWGMYVRPDLRRSGVGRALLGAAIAHARTLPGIAQLCLSVSSAAPGAQALYASMGFEAWGTEPRAICVEGQMADEVHMLRPLEEGPR